MTFSRFYPNLPGYLINPLCTSQRYRFPKPLILGVGRAILASTRIDPAFMLRANPKGGRPLKGLGGIDWDGTYGGFQYKLGYCEHGGKILATGEELTEIVQEFGYLVKPKKRVVRGVALYLLKKLV